MVWLTSGSLLLAAVRNNAAESMDATGTVTLSFRRLSGRKGLNKAPWTIIQRRRFFTRKIAERLWTSITALKPGSSEGPLGMESTGVAKGRCLNQIIAEMVDGLKTPLLKHLRITVQNILGGDRGSQPDAVDGIDDLVPGQAVFTRRIVRRCASNG